MAALPSLSEMNPAQIARAFELARARQLHAAKGHRAVRDERKTMAAAAECEDAEDGADTHEQHMAMHVEHDRIAGAHQALADVYASGDAVDPRDRAKAEELAGERIPQPVRVDAEGKPTEEQPTDFALERERHFWLLRQRKGLAVCVCAECEGERAAKDAEAQGLPRRHLALS